MSLKAEIEYAADALLHHSQNGSHPLGEQGILSPADYEIIQAGITEEEYGGMHVTSMREHVKYSFQRVREHVQDFAHEHPLAMTALGAVVGGAVTIAVEHMTQPKQEPQAPSSTA